MALAQSNQPDDYLAVIWQLTSPIGERPEGKRMPTAAARIAEELGISRVSVGEMLNKLEERGLISRGSRKEAILTSEGRALAMRSIRKHRLVSSFLAHDLDYPIWQLLDRTPALVDGFDEEAIERLYVHLGEPERSPHGFPIDPDHELRENATLTLAYRTHDGVKGEVVRVGERHPDVQRRLAQAGILPGARVAVRHTGADSLVLTLDDGREVVLDALAARSVYLRPDGVPAVPATASCWADIMLRERNLAREGAGATDEEHGY